MTDENRFAIYLGSVGAALLLALALAGCGRATGRVDGSIADNGGGAARFTAFDQDGTERGFGLNEDVRVIQDGRTGVRYLAYRRGNSVGLTPLLDADGTVQRDPEAGGDE